MAAGADLHFPLILGNLQAQAGKLENLSAVARHPIQVGEGMIATAMLGLQPAVHYLVGIIHKFESLAFVTSLTPLLAFAFVP